MSEALNAKEHWNAYKERTDVLFNKSLVNKFIKEQGTHISQIDALFWIKLNEKIKDTLRGAIHQNGSRKRLTQAELQSGSDYGIRYRK